MRSLRDRRVLVRIIRGCAALRQPSATVCDPSGIIRAPTATRSHTVAGGLSAANIPRTQATLASDGVNEIFKIGQGDRPQFDLFDPDYLAKIDKIKLPNTKIKLLQQLLAKVT